MVPDREALALDILADAHRTGKTLTQEAFKEALKEELRHKVDLARLAGAVTAFATGQDIDIATKTATNAVENNFVPLILGAAAVGSTLWTGYDVFTTYQEEGAEAAVKKLVVYGVVGVVTYGTGKYVIKGVQYLTATAAWDAYVSSSPLMIKLSTKLSEAGHRVMRSSLGQRFFQGASDKTTSGFGVNALSLVRGKSVKAGRVSTKKTPRIYLKKGNASSSPEKTPPETSKSKVKEGGASERPIESPYYTTLFKVQLEKNAHYPGKSDKVHFREANQQLYAQMQKDPRLKSNFVANK